MDEKLYEVRIETNGTRGRLFVGEKELSGCTSAVSLSHDAGQIPEVTVTLGGIAPVVFVGEAYVRWNAATGTGIRYIEFEDGSTFGTPSK